VLPEAERIPAIVDDARKRFTVAAEIVDRALDGRDFICGSELTAADVMVAYPLALAKITDELPKTLASVAAYLGRLRERPAYAKAWERDRERAETGLPPVRPAVRRRG
jgi:glutathione S-transferase